MKHIVIAALVGLLSVPALAEGENVSINPPADGTVSREDGMAAWAKLRKSPSRARREIHCIISR